MSEPVIGLLPFKGEEGEKEELSLSKDNGKKGEATKGAKKKKAAKSKKPRTRKELLEKVLLKAEKTRKELKNVLNDSKSLFWDNINDHDRKSLFELTGSLPGFKSEEEIAIACGTDLASIRKWCLATYNKPLAKVIEFLRAMDKRNFIASQQVLAVTNPAMSIWLGKNYYLQKDGEDKKELDLSDFFNVVIKPKLGDR